MGFTHIELLPVSEHPFDPSWGYQPTGLFAPTSRFGSPDGFARFVNRAHEQGIGHHPRLGAGPLPHRRFGLARFDGTALYEHEDPRQGYHPDWNTAIYNFGRREVLSFLINNALFWCGKYHIDGCAWMRSPRCSISTIPEGRRVDSQRMAGARTSRPSPSCNA